MAPSGIPGELPEVIQPYQLRGLCLVDLVLTPLLVGTELRLRMKTQIIGRAP